MKKLLNISVIAALAVLPVAANATPVAGAPTTLPTTGTGAEEAIAAAKASSGPTYALVEADQTDNNLATAGYVKGAYNASMKAINKVAEMATGATDTIEARLETNTPSENGYDINAKTLDVNGNTTVGGTLGVTGATTLEDNLTVGGNASVTGTTTLTGDATVNNVTVSSGKALSTQGATIAAGTGTTVTGTLNAGGATITGTSGNEVVIDHAEIDADDNVITNLETDNFKTGVIQTTLRDSSSASDTALASEKAVRTAIDSINTNSSITTNGHYVDAGQSVTHNLIELDNAVYAIDTTVIPVMASWGSTTATQNTIADLRTRAPGQAQAQAGE